MNFNSLRKSTALFLSTCLLIGSGCKSDKVANKVLGGAPLTDTATTTTPSGVASYFSGVATTGGTTATAVSATLPASNGGPTVTSVTGGSNVINGGSSQVTLTGSASFTHVYVAAANVTVTAPGAAGVVSPDIAGYYDLTLPAAVTSVTIIITITQTLTDTSFNRVFELVNASGLVGAPDNTATTIVARVGTGDLQVSLSWDTATDVDLHVLEPSGNEIYYANKGPSASGGTLDLDSNAGCTLDNKNNENITWTTAPSGIYKVYVDYWSACSVSGATKYTVTVTKSGVATTFTGTFTAGNANGAGACNISGNPCTTITTFTK